ncbi:MAG TPA: hypothetical protein PKE69_12730, partial [Pyrinomonadaceae bacterium]|nr:hypothetical protein [Pyrinomonadaceae bacterium]
TEQFDSAHISAAIKLKREYGLRCHQLESPCNYVCGQFRQCMPKHDFRFQRQSNFHVFSC